MTKLTMGQRRCRFQVVETFEVLVLEVWSDNTYSIQLHSFRDDKKWTVCWKPGPDGSGLSLAEALIKLGEKIAEDHKPIYPVRPEGAAASGIATIFVDRRPISQIGGSRAYLRQIWESLKLRWKK